jgi:hypothetical protein
MPPLSDEDLSGLSAAEREALRELDDNDEDVVAAFGQTASTPPPAPGAAPAPAPDDEDDDDGGTDPAQASVATTTPAPTAPAPAPAPSEPDVGQTASAAASAAPDAGEKDADLELLRVTPDNIEEQRKALRIERTEALQKMLDGEMTREDFQAMDERVSSGLDQLVRAEATDAARQQIRMDSMLGDYGKGLRSSRAQLKAAGLDSEAVSGEFDRALRMFAKEAHDRGLEDNPGALNASRDALAEAVAYVLRRHGKATAAASPAPLPAPVAAPVPATPTPKRDTSPVDRSTLPPTLAGVPVAADASISSEFAHLEGLDAIELERAVARMTPEQQERWVDAA